MNIELLDFQGEYVAELLDRLKKAKRHVDDGELESVLLSAPTGSGKTVMMADLIERVCHGTDGFEPEPDAVFLWLSDQPELNEQSRARLLSASSRLRDQHLVVVGPEFDQETFEGGKVYFLNTQKLGKDKNLTTKGDKRTWTIWETVENTALKLSDRFYLVIDEAHRGMNKSSQQDNEAKTIAQKFLFGFNGTMKPVPLVIGISATPERFERLIDHSDRHIYKVIVDVTKVRESGLLKDELTVRIPDDDHPNDWTLLKAAAGRWKKMRDEWRTYCHSQGIPVVAPIMVVQVEDGTGGRLTNTSLDAAIRAIEEAVGSVSNEELAHCFQEEREITTTGHKIRYIPPSQVAADSTVKFVFFKMALTTGWDCPRAEVMMSFRKAVDATLIAQLVGRMVRTPLARRIEDNETLNEVHLYLPHYDEDSLKSVIDKLEGDHDAVPATRVRRGKDVDELRVPDSLEHIRQLLMKLPTYIVKGGRKQPDFKKLMRFATLLTIRDGLDTDAFDEATKLIVDTLTEKRDALVAGNSEFKAQVAGLGKVTLKPLVVNQQTFDVTEGHPETVDISERNIDDLYRLAKQRLGEDLAIAYIKANYDEDEPYKAKLELYLLLQRLDVWNALETRAQGLFSTLWTRHQPAINALESSRRARYDEIWARSRKPEQTNFSPPREISLPKSPAGVECGKHLYVDTSGKFRTQLGGWEGPVLQAEMPSCVAWLRNLPNKPWALAYPYQMNGQTKPGFPDFLVVRDTGSGLTVDILEPHNPGLADAWAKAKGLAEFADRVGSYFGRIEMQQVKNGKIIRLDFRNPVIRERAMSLNSSTDLNNLFSDRGFESPV